MIELRNIAKQYPNGTVAVSDLSMTAPTGKITMLVGPSGCGKTTTLRMVNRLVQPSSGSILLNGEDSTTIDVSSMRRKIGYVIQNGGLFPHRTILDNVCSVPFLTRAGRSRDQKLKTRQRAYELLDLVGIPSDYANRYPWQLSGGQQQRVGVARALAADPPFMLMDEPFSAVDPIMRAQLQAEFLQIQSKLAKTIMMVTHDIDEALKLGDYIAVFKEGGVLAQLGTPTEILMNPADSFVADFVGKSRGYHALHFRSIGDMTLTSTATLTVGSEAGERAGSWVVALDAQAHPLGWFHAGAASETLTEERIRMARPVSLVDGNYQQLLDAALLSPNGCAIVVNADGAYAGTKGVDEVTRAAAGLFTH